MHGGRKRVEGGERGRMKSLWSEKNMTQGKRERKKNRKRDSWEPLLGFRVEG